MTPKLSILMPTYNGEAFLDEQIESILAQTDADFELLVIDDGSTDGTPEALRRFAARDRRITVMPSSGNAGQNARLAELLGRACGAHIAIADQDDRWALDRNERLFAAMEGRPMAFGRSELIDGAGKPVGKSLLEFCNAEFRPDDKLRALLAPVFSAHATITRRDRVSPHAFWHPMPFDWLMALEALFTEGLVYRDDAVVFHRIHGGNQMNNIRVDRGAARLTGSDVRYMLFFQRPGRLKLWLVFDYLGRSTLIDPALRRTFQKLAGLCQSVWFSEWRALRTSDAGLRGRIIDALAPLAASDADRAAFERQIVVLTSPLLGRDTLGEMRRRYRLWRGAD